MVNPHVPWKRGNVTPRAYSRLARCRELQARGLWSPHVPQGALREGWASAWLLPRAASGCSPRQAPALGVTAALGSPRSVRSSATCLGPWAVGAHREALWGPRCVGRRWWLHCTGFVLVSSHLLCLLPPFRGVKIRTVVLLGLISYAAGEKV